MPQACLRHDDARRAKALDSARGRALRRSVVRDFAVIRYGWGQADLNGDDVRHGPVAKKVMVSTVGHGYHNNPA